MPKFDKENVIDLCDSSDDDDVVFVKQGSSTRIAPISDFSLDNNKVIFGTHPSNPYPVKKRPRLQATTEVAAAPHAAKLSPEQNHVLLFIGGDGMDNAAITEDVAALLKDIPHVRSCFTGTNAPRMIHVQQRDKWSCGFRNLQMLLSSVVPILPNGHSYYQHHPDSRQEGFCSIPSVLRLQELMEQSWAMGYDRQGAEHYGGRIVGSSKQIGAAEVSNLLSFCGIENTVIQFVTCLESRSLVGPFCLSYFSKLQQNHMHSCHCYNRNGTTSSLSLAHQLLSMSKSVLDGRQALCTCPLLPLYLQWEGHSVTIVGVETDGHGDRNIGMKGLLVFDPSAAGSTLKKSLQMRNLQPLRFPLSKLKGKDCQIVLTSLEPLSCMEQEQLKLQLRAVTAAPDAVKRARNLR